MPAVHQFAYGPLNPVAGYLMACIGSLIGLAAAAQARATDDRRRSVPWLGTAAVTIGTGIWLMHFMGMLGVDIPEATVRYDPPMLAISGMVAILVVGVGIFVAGYGPESGGRIMAGGAFTGGGIAAMYFTGMGAMRLPGTIGYDPSIAALSVLLAVITATVALWVTLTVDGWWPRCLASAILAAAGSAMHYTAMSSLRIHLSADAGPVRGIDPIMLVLPITVIAAAALIGLVFTALQAATQEEPLPAHRLRSVPRRRGATRRCWSEPVRPVAPKPAQVPVEPPRPAPATGTVHVGQLIVPPRYAGTNGSGPRPDGTSGGVADDQLGGQDQRRFDLFATGQS